MKRFILFIGLVFLSCNFWAQDFNKLASFKFENEASYKSAEEDVLSAANYLFDNPTTEGELERRLALQFIMKWMEGTPDYTFEIDADVMELTKGDSDLLGLYLAAASKAVIESDDDKLNSSQIYSRAEAIMLEYCSDSKNKQKPSRKMKKLLKKQKS